MNDIVSKLLPSKGPSTTLTVVSLAQKYNLPPEKRQQVQAVENDLYYSLPEKMREDERVVCAIFAVVSKRLGLVSDSYNFYRRDVYHFSRSLTTNGSQPKPKNTN